MGLARTIRRWRRRKAEAAARTTRGKALLEPLEPRLLLDSVMWDGGGELN